MIYSVNFEELAERISHLDAAKYLHDLGWSQVPSKRNMVQVFQLENQHGFFQADLPTSRSLRDYGPAMYRTIQCIAQSVCKSVEQVVLELLNPLSDIIRMRIDEPTIAGGSILFEDAINLYDNAKKLVQATAMDIVSPRLRHNGRPEKNVIDFVNKCRFGQTEIGSYVVSVVCPIFKIDDNKQIAKLSLYSEEEECAESFTRQVVNKLINSVKAVKEAIDQGEGDRIVRPDAGPNDCISVDFLKALSGINIYRNGSTLDIAAKYAPTIKNNTLENPSVSIGSDYFEPIDTLVKKDKGSQENEKAYFGKIKSLDAPPDPAARKEGKITIVFVDNTRKAKTARAVLQREDYDAALEAHRDGRTVRLVGPMLEQSGKKKIECRRFDVLE